MFLKFSCFCLAIVVALLVLGDSAGARGVHVVGVDEPCPVAHPKSNVAYSCSEEFTARGSNGYRITVSADFGPGSILLSAQGPSGDVYYNAPAKVTKSTIKAKLGRLGRISVRFRPSGKERRVRVSGPCSTGLFGKERPHVVRSVLGSFVGMIEFHGERGYTTVSAQRVSGAIGDPASNTAKKRVCGFHESDAEHREELESVSLDGSPVGHHISFSAFRLFGNLSPGHGRYTFLASAIEKKRSISITRVAGTSGAQQDFLFDQGLTSATVTPPAPFTGTGTFVRGTNGSTSWSGDLAVPLPGLGLVNLTGGKAALETVAEENERFEETAAATFHGSG